MPAHPTRGAIPIELPIIGERHAGIVPADTLQAVTDAFNAVLKVGQSAFTDGVHNYAVVAHPSQHQAVAHAGDDFKIGDYAAPGNTVWLTILSPDEPNLPTLNAISGALTDQTLTKFLELTDGTPEAQAFNSLLAPENLGVRYALLDAVMYEARMEAFYDLPDEPNGESVELGDGRGAYVKEVEKINPVYAIIDDNEPYAVVDAMRERNIDYIGTSDAKAVESALTTWSDDQKEEAAPAIEALGFSVSQCEEILSDQCRDILCQRGGSIELEPWGKFALTLVPKIGKEQAYITFDGISSSSFNAVVDESYLCMLDTLKISPKAWVNHLAEISGLPKPNWDLDLQSLIKDSVQHADQSASHGILWSNPATNNLKEAIVQELFFNDLSENDLTEGTVNTAHYLFDIALEPLKVLADELDGQWLRDHHVDVDQLQQISSSRGQLEAFPQLTQFPRFQQALVNMGSNGAVDYDWKLSPAHYDGKPLIPLDRVQSVLENASYSGNVAIAFTCDYDDLLRIGKAAHNGQADKLEIDGAYFHIQDFNNGAGDGEPLSEPITINCDDLVSKWEVRNDSTDRCGIYETFGQFLATDCRLMIKHGAQLEKTADAENSAPSLA
jgi:hypothetical protein